MESTPKNRPSIVLHPKKNVPIVVSLLPLLLLSVIGLWFLEGWWIFFSVGLCFTLLFGLWALSVAKSKIEIYREFILYRTESNTKLRRMEITSIKGYLWESISFQTGLGKERIFLYSAKRTVEIDAALFHDFDKFRKWASDALTPIQASQLNSWQRLRIFLLRLYSLGFYRSNLVNK